MRTAPRSLLPVFVALLVLFPVLSLGSCDDEPPLGYSDGYTYGRDGSVGRHLSDATPEDTGAAESECGEHAETDSVETNRVWMAGCVDGALRLPSSPPPAPSAGP